MKVTTIICTSVQKVGVTLKNFVCAHPDVVVILISALAAAIFRPLIYVSLYAVGALIKRHCPLEKVLRYIPPALSLVCLPPFVVGLWMHWIVLSAISIVVFGLINGIHYPLFIHPEVGHREGL